jgi:uncharacterized protein involved in exopolysaccharide biosynthesis
VVNNEELDLLEIIHKLWKKKFFLMVCVLIPAIIAMVVSFLLPKKYTSSATILAPEVAGGGGIIQTPFGGISTSGLGKKTISSQAVIALLKSDEMILSIINHFHLKEKLGIKKERATIKYVSQKMTSIELLAETGVIKISVETNSKELSKAILDFYLSNLEVLNDKYKLTSDYPVVKVISPPYIPERKSFPKPKMNMEIAGFLGLILGLSYIYLKEKIS